VVDELRGKGAIFVDSEDEVPNGERVITAPTAFRPEVREHSARRGLRVIDATCPLCHPKSTSKPLKFAKEGYSLILIGHHDHDEVIGTLGEAPLVTQVVGNPEQVKSLSVPDPNRVAYLTKPRSASMKPKTSSLPQEKVPNIKGPAAQDICYATEKPPGRGQASRLGI